MESPISKTNGQAVIELTVVATIVLILITGTFALTGTLKKEMKHDFIEPDNNPTLNATLVQTTEELEKFFDKGGRYFPKQKMTDVILKMENEGWAETSKIKTAKGIQNVELTNGEKKIALIHTKDGVFGVYLQD